MNKPIYFDNAATTEVFPEVIENFSRISAEIYGNPHSNHRIGYQARDLLTKAREQILALLELEAYQVVFTSGATESNNLAIQGVALSFADRGHHLITTAGEHPSVMKVFEFLQEHHGFEVTVLPLNEEGVINLSDLEKALNKNTILVSVMAVNNQTGAISPLKEIAQLLTKYPKCLFHSDVTQGIAKTKLPYQVLDLLSFSAHKIHGLKGSGALILKKNLALKPLFYGGEQEEGLRSGTVAVPLDVCLAQVLRLSLKREEETRTKVQTIHDFLYHQLVKEDDLVMNSPLHASPYIINFSLRHLPSSVVVEALSNAGIMVASTAACSERKNLLSASVLSMFNDQKRAKNTIRISFSYDNTMEEAQVFLTTLKGIFKKLHEAYL
ncbi:MAG: cysteine desulfurase family protein [Bacilli bacterium]